MAGIVAIGLYFALNVCLGLYLHHAAQQDSDVKPKLAELLVYFPVAALFGLPIVIAVVISGLVLGLMHKESHT